jgi:hypothetical protein
VTITVWGEAGGPGTHAAIRDRFGRVFEARSYRDLELELPAEGIEVDCDHDQRPVGRLLYAELGADNRLRAVCVLDNDGLEQVEQGVFFSPMFEMRGDGINDSDTYIARTAQLLALSITFDTARVGAHPVNWRRGDLRDSVDRFGWPYSWQGSDPLLARALDHNRTGWQSRSRTPRGSSTGDSVKTTTRSSSVARLVAIT